MIILPTLLSTWIVALLWTRYGLPIAWPSGCALILLLAIRLLEERNWEVSHKATIRILWFVLSAVMLFSAVRASVQEVPPGSMIAPVLILVLMKYAHQLGAEPQAQVQSDV